METKWLFVSFHMSIYKININNRTKFAYKVSACKFSNDNIFKMGLAPAENLKSTFARIIEIEKPSFTILFQSSRINEQVG